MLIGFMGSGKSSVGRVLEQRTSLPRYDTDQMISTNFGIAISEIFKRHGEDEFRRRETAVLHELPHRNAIIVTGGGVVLREENVTILRERGALVNLTADEETLFERATRRNSRPLLQTEAPRETLSRLLHARAPLYRAAADFELDTSALTHDQVAQAILSRIETLRAHGR